MKCSSCKEEINPKFTHAITNNVCPFCGEQIMPPKLQTLLTDFKILMEDAKEFPDEINDWLEKNYGLRKFDPTKHEQVSQGTTTYADFAKRAGVPNAPKFKQLIEHIHGDNEPGQEAEMSDEAKIAMADQEMLMETVPQEKPISPLKPVEVQALSDAIFPDDTPELLEIEKLKRIRKQMAGGGNFRRGE